MLLRAVKIVASATQSIAGIYAMHAIISAPSHALRKISAPASLSLAVPSPLLTMNPSRAALQVSAMARLAIAIQRIANARRRIQNLAVHKVERGNARAAIPLPLLSFTFVALRRPARIHASSTN